MIKAVIFDWGGVLMRTCDPQPRRTLEAEYGLPPGSLENLIFGSPAWARCQAGELSDEEFWADRFARPSVVTTSFGRPRGLSPERVADFRRRFFAGDRLDGELIAFIRSLRPRLKVALLSNFSTRLRDILDEYGVSDAFDAIVISGEEGVVKPEARIYHIACRRLEVSPAEAVFVDDGIENVRGAQQAGLQAIRFVSTAQIIQALRLATDLGGEW